MNLSHNLWLIDLATNEGAEIKTNLGVNKRHSHIITLIGSSNLRMCPSDCPEGMLFGALQWFIRPIRCIYPFGNFIGLKISTNGFRSFCWWLTSTNELARSSFGSKLSGSGPLAGASNDPEGIFNAPGTNDPGMKSCPARNYKLKWGWEKVKSGRPIFRPGLRTKNMDGKFWSGVDFSDLIFPDRSGLFKTMCPKIPDKYL